MAPKNTTSVWFIRHGESTSNAGAVSSDRSAPVLTEKGLVQAKNVSLKILLRPELIVVTPYIRTHQTAQPLRERYPDAPCETWDLHEFSPLSDNNYINRTQVQQHSTMQAFWERNDPEYVDGAGAESFSAMTQRINEGLTRLRKRTEKFIVVFAHGDILQTLRLLLGKPEASLRAIMKSMPYYMEHSPIDNGAIIRVEMDTQSMRIHQDDFKIIENQNP
jgi:broad specificity phosphatase PhoE